MDHKIPEAFLNPDVWKWIKAYGVNATKNFQEINSTRDGLFAPSCLIHCEFELDKPIIDGINVATALFNWAKQYMPSNELHAMNGSHIHMDTCKSGVYYPPCNPTCPKLSDKFLGAGLGK